MKRLWVWSYFRSIEHVGTIKTYLMFFACLLEHGETHCQNMQNCVVLCKTKEGHKKTPWNER
jgi:hypothetical protein